MDDRDLPQYGRAPFRVPRRSTSYHTPHKRSGTLPWRCDPWSERGLVSRATFRHLKDIRSMVQCINNIHQESRKSPGFEHGFASENPLTFIDICLNVECLATPGEAAIVPVLKGRSQPQCHQAQEVGSAPSVICPGAREPEIHAQARG